ncbi:Hsp33 family molecular chaperone HslO [Sterolibacterium denitrificans]|uniref:Hsp33 family molecular chaperone HslO n=1 Tax=Sterolibacterium denitrificans TaxID=157592 RepID=UPI001E445FAF|nr:Hsp33 family molecular chaperone HslO [Sterolibacterium denitrificans]
MESAESLITRFMFENLDICGAVVQLSGTWQQMHAGRDYAQQTRDLLGELAAVAAVIGSNLKTPGRATFQAQGQKTGPISLLVVDCEQSGSGDQLLLRGMARSKGEVAAAPLHELLGDGKLLFSLQTAAASTPYQSYVPLDGGSIAQVFEQFMSQSAQQPARLWLFADGAQAAGLFLQTMPAREHAATVDPDGWNRVQQLAATLQRQELQLPATTLLERLFSEDDLRVFAPIPVHYHCPRDEDKVRSMLISLGHQEVAGILAEYGEIVVRDDICNHEYRFGAEIIAELFPSAGQTLH